MSELFPSTFLNTKLENVQLLHDFDCSLFIVIALYRPKED